MLRTTTVVRVRSDRRFGARRRAQNLASRVNLSFIRGIGVRGHTVPRVTPRSLRYLLYTRHSRVDVFRGALAGMVRRIVEKRIRSDAPEVLAGLRRRLESGDPPSVTSSAQ